MVRLIHISFSPYFYYMKPVIGLIVGVLLFLFGYQLDIRLLQEEQEELQKKILVIKEEKRRAVENSKESIGVRQVISKKDAINVLRFLEKAINISRLKLRLFEVLPFKGGQDIGIDSIKLELKGSAKNLLVFVDKLLHAPFLVVVEELIVQRKSIDNLDIELLLAVCSGEEGLAKQDLFFSSLERDVFKEEYTKHGLHLWSGEEMFFLGLIKDGKSIFGIIGDPLGGVYRVTVGDKVGLNNSEILLIDDNGITTINSEDNIWRN